MAAATDIELASVFMSVRGVVAMVWSVLVWSQTSLPMVTHGCFSASVGVMVVSGLTHRLSYRISDAVHWFE